MDTPTYWHRQEAQKPLFSQLMWNKPETRTHAGKLLIVGGNAHSLTAPGLAYAAALRAGAGTARVVLPDAVKKTIGQSFEEGEFAPSTRSGSFGKKALAQILDASSWADMLLLAGDLGRNSETAILLDELLMRYGGPITLSGDAIDYFIDQPRKVWERPNTLLVCQFGQLQKMASKHEPPILVKHSMSLHALAGVMNAWSKEQRAMLLSHHSDQLMVAADGQISTTPGSFKDGWQTPLSAYAATWWLQQPAKPFAAVTTAVFDYLKA